MSKEEVDHLSLSGAPSEQTPDSSRRRFLKKIWAGLGVVALAEFFWVFIGFVRPRKPTAREGAFGGIIDAGPVEAFEPESVTANIRGQFYVCRLKDGGILAVSRKCTHLGCTVPWDAGKQQFICPCHASAFDITGEVMSAPAPRALDIHPVIIENNVVKVDTGTKIKRKSFEVSQVVTP